MRVDGEVVDYFEVPPAHSGLLNKKIKTTSVSIYGIGHLGSWAARVIGKDMANAKVMNVLNN